MADCQHIDVDCFSCIFLVGINDFWVSFSHKYNNKEKDCYSMYQTYRIFSPFLWGYGQLNLYLITSILQKKKEIWSLQKSILTFTEIDLWVNSKEIIWIFSAEDRGKKN